MVVRRRGSLPGIVLPQATVLLLLLLSCCRHVDALVACNTTQQCQDILVSFNTECIFQDGGSGGTCSNPFSQGGCLKQHLENGKKIRVCNSDDTLPEAIERGDCRMSPLDYGEVRFMSQNWESAFFVGWIQQILLSELLEVPTSMETGVLGKMVNFYDDQLHMDYGTSNDWPAMNRSSHYNGDCSVALANGESCAHVNPEVWEGQSDLIQELIDEDRVEPSTGMGALGRQAWFIPRITALKDPSLLTYLGLKGQENRNKLASTFLWPTTWKDYCELVSIDNCTTPDDTAQRAPSNEDEAGVFYSVAEYRGYFRHTDTNNCTLNPTTCKGHMADYPCTWSSYATPQAYYNDIAIEVVLYTYGELTQIWSAANATGSDLLLHWWTPEAIYQSMVGTQYELLLVSLPPPNQDCIEHRITPADRCSDDPQQQLGDPLGACDEPAFPLQKVIAKSLYTMSKGPGIPEAVQSPAYDAVKAFTISDFQLGRIFDYWLEAQAAGYPSGYGARAATCRWVVENLDLLQAFIPRSYPRVMESADESAHETLKSPLNLFALVFACFAAALVLIVTVGVYRHRDRRVMRRAQVEFLWLLLMGLIMVSLAAIVLVVPPTNASCLVSTWLFNVGYTLELVPLIVKVAAIGQMMRAARQCRRVVLERKSLFRIVAGICSVIVLYLILWTAIDPPQKETELQLSEQATEEGATIITTTSFCQSNHSDVWRFLSIAWHALMLVSATVLAFQTRKLQHDINETQVLAILIYSHFFFVVLRVVTFFLEESIGDFQAVIFRSILLSADIVATCVIYFLPKLLAASGGNDNNTRQSRLHTMGFRGAFLTTVAGMHGFNSPPSTDGVAVSMASADSNISQVSEYQVPVRDAVTTNTRASEGAAASVADTEEDIDTASGDKRIAKDLDKDSNSMDPDDKDQSVLTAFCDEQVVVEEQAKPMLEGCGLRCRHCGVVN